MKRIEELKAKIAAHIASGKANSDKVREYKASEDKRIKQESESARNKDKKVRFKRRKKKPAKKLALNKMKGCNFDLAVND